MGTSETINVALWGAPGVGKTTFLGALLAQVCEKLPHEEAQHLRQHRVFKGTAERLTDGNVFPSPTTAPHHIEWQHRPTLKIRIVDLPGTWCSGSIDTLKNNPISAPLGSAWKYLYNTSDVILVMIASTANGEIAHTTANFLKSLQDGNGNIHPHIVYLISIVNEQDLNNLSDSPAIMFRERFGDPSESGSPFFGLPASHTLEAAQILYVYPSEIDAANDEIWINKDEGGALPVFEVVLNTLLSVSAPPPSVSTAPAPAPPEYAPVPAATAPTPSPPPPALPSLFASAPTTSSSVHSSAPSTSMPKPTSAPPPTPPGAARLQIATPATRKLMSTMDGNWIDRLIAEGDQLRVGIWGLKASGKTAMIGRLIDWLSRTGWTVQMGRSTDPSAVFFRDNIQKVIARGQFPNKTELATGASLYRFTLHTPSPAVVKPTMPLEAWMKTHPSFKLVFLDAPGENLHDFLNPCKINPTLLDPTDIKRDERSFSVLDYLSACHGIIILIDPYDTTLEAEAYLQLLLDVLRNLRDYFPNQVYAPQYFSLAFTKIDMGDYSDKRTNALAIARDLYGSDVDNRLSDYTLFERRQWETISLKEVPPSPRHPVPGGQQFLPVRKPYNLTGMLFRLMERMVNRPPILDDRTLINPPQADDDDE